MKQTNNKDFKMNKLIHRRPKLLFLLHHLKKEKQNRHKFLKILKKRLPVINNRLIPQKIRIIFRILKEKSYNKRKINLRNLMMKFKKQIIYIHNKKMKFNK